ncbi:MAG: ABC transporter ATP-binding protein [Pirellulales bacterium]|nr:ABC transporter ATP-binding protein [Pirellulales bacterium]
MIELERVSKEYSSRRGTVRALDDVSLTVATGEYVAVRGPSGCGKSTLLTLVAGLNAPTSGRVVVAGQDLAAMSSGQRAAWRAATIGFVFQLFHLLPYLTVLDNVLMASAGGDRSGRARQLLQRFGLGEREHHRPAELSIGERQRVAMARALLNEPKLLLADEPTGNLDAANAAAVLDQLADFHRGGGTVLLVTHDAQAAARAERSFFLERGRVAHQEPAIDRALV